MYTIVFIRSDGHVGFQAPIKVVTYVYEWGSVNSKATISRVLVTEGRVLVTNKNGTTSIWFKGWMSSQLIGIMGQF